MLVKLAEAHKAQTQAIQRFALAQARLAQLETRLQAVQTRPQIAQPSPTYEASAHENLASVETFLEEEDLEGEEPTERIPMIRADQLLAISNPTSQTVSEDIEVLSQANAERDSVQQVE